MQAMSCRPLLVSHNGKKLTACMNASPPTVLQYSQCSSVAKERGACNVVPRRCCQETVTWLKPVTRASICPVTEPHELLHVGNMARSVDGRRYSNREWTAPHGRSKSDESIGPCLFAFRG